ncbi:MAG: hypothetical protein M3447_08725 [Acidobacteriota bacterium]|nr:hypothetical protein [Acidobacteriota bacterium]
MRRNPPFDLDAKRLELLRRLNEIPGVSLPEDSLARAPVIALKLLADERAYAQFTQSIEWTIEEVKAAAKK